MQEFYDPLKNLLAILQECISAKQTMAIKKSEPYSSFWKSWDDWKSWDELGGGKDNLIFF